MYVPPNVVTLYPIVLTLSRESEKIVLFYQSGTVSILDKSYINESKDIGTMAAFNRILNGRELTFKKVKGVFKDIETVSSWDITGFCYKGKYKGEQLKIEPHSNHFAFAWLAFYPDSVIFTN